MIDIRKFQAGEWLLVALAVVGLGVVFMPTPNPCDAKIVRVEIADAVWSIPADLQPELVGFRGGRVFPTRFGGGRHSYCRSATSPPLPQQVFRLDKAAFGTVAFRDPERFGPLARVEQFSLSEDGSRPRAPGAGETYGPVLFGHRTIRRCTDVKALSRGRIKLDCRIRGWTPSGGAVWLLYDDHLDDSAIVALEALLRDFLKPA